MSNILTDEQRAWIGRVKEINERARAGLSENAFIDATGVRAKIEERERFLSIIDTLTTALEAERTNATSQEVAALKATNELGSIKVMLDHIDEFGHPIDPDAKLGPIAERVYSQFAEYATALEAEQMRAIGLASLNDAWKVEVEMERGKVGKLEDNLNRLRRMRSGIRSAVDGLVVDKQVVDELEVIAIDRRISDLIDESIHYEIRQRPSPEPGADHDR